MVAVIFSVTGCVMEGRVQEKGGGERERGRPPTGQCLCILGGNKYLLVQMVNDNDQSKNTACSCLQLLDSRGPLVELHKDRKGREKRVSIV